MWRGEHTVGVEWWWPRRKVNGLERSRILDRTWSLRVMEKEEEGRSREDFQDFGLNDWRNTLYSGRWDRKRSSLVNRWLAREMYTKGPMAELRGELTEFFVLFLNWVFFFFLSFIFISWRLITSQHCSGFGHTLTWISHGVTCIPHPDPPSHLPLHSIPLGLPSAPGPSTCLMHPTWAGDLFHYR